MAENELDLAAARSSMVAHQLRERGIADERVLAAMARLPREAFVRERQRPWAYADEALPIDAGQTISQPFMVARMTELLEPRPGDSVLEVGTGTGYQAAVLAWLGCRVISIERHAELAEAARARLQALGLGLDVEVRVGDGSLGAPDAAPFSGIVVTAAAPQIPLSLRNQLADGGRLVIPVGPRDRQDLIVVVRHGDEWRESSDGPCVFVPLVGAEGFG
ncbi:MAG TPA: protein-L-isoaspartate(D-aspartate) O-methyltransferase [Candidatus Saccharimonadales bacterium]|nr:protein-L-isoaspartate(D-aspartate) O-methyltransferase [Candidatus Saccharimonadales bacterium]